MGYLEDLFGLQGKNALVTGGATGIGRMIAEALAMAGGQVMIASRSDEDCARAADEINRLAFEGKTNGSAEGFKGDLSTDASIAALAEAVSRRAEKLHILVNNAGVTWGAPLESFPHDAWEKVMRVNVAGLFTLTKSLLPQLRAAATRGDPARIVNLGSVMGTRPMADMAYSYAASKAAVHHLTEIFANEFAAHSITCNALAPGPFKSRMTAFATEDAESARQMADRVPLGRLGAPSDAAGAALYLCGRAGAYVTGAILPVDGGLKASSPTNLFPR